ncbi:unnamed protein product [Lathyrus sativus]|nr:unnamed protein product [Lathyrus sativus]
MLQSQYTHSFESILPLLSLSNLSNIPPPALKVVKQRSELLGSYLLNTGVGEVINEEVHGSQAEALVVRRQTPLQFLVIDQTASILICHLEARHDARISSRRECRWQQCFIP